jgi:hypothetical protein
MNRHLNNERQKCKTGHVNMCKYETLKPVEAILRRGAGEEGIESNGGDEPNQSMIDVYM